MPLSVYAERDRERRKPEKEQATKRAKPVKRERAVRSGVEEAAHWQRESFVEPEWISIYENKTSRKRAK